MLGAAGRGGEAREEEEEATTADVLPLLAEKDPHTLHTTAGVWKI